MDSEEDDGKMTSPTQLSLKELRKRGYIAGITEKFNPFIKIRQDLWGFADLACAHPEKKEFLLVQATSGDNVAARVKKIEENDNAKKWLQAGGKISVWGWRKSGKANKRKLWTLREVEVDV